MTTTLRKCPGVAFKASKKTFVLQETICPRRWFCLRFVDLDHTTDQDLTEISFLSPKEVYPMCEDYLSVPPEVRDGSTVHQGTGFSRKLGR
jgi:hypothetical protein